MKDTIGRQASIDVNKPWYTGLNKAPSSVRTYTYQNAYEQGRIAGRTEMRTEILEALKKLVGSEVWNNI